MSTICTQIKPDWDGAPVSMFAETLSLASAPITLILLTATIITLHFRHQWAALALVVAWSFYVSFLTILDPENTFALARAEGCLGAPTLFIVAVAAICITMVFYTAPNEARKT